MNLKEQFATYEIALKLKELGFDEPCIAYYTSDKYHDLCHGCENMIDGNFVIVDTRYLKAPLWQQIEDWLRENHDKHIRIQEGYTPSKHYYEFEIPWKTFKTYHQAREHVILRILQNI